jgi:hypothetical protein
MGDFPHGIVISGLAGLAMTIVAALHAWRGWLDLKRLEIEQRGGTSAPAARIEIADLRERVRKLEAIAAGVDW